MPNRGYWLKMVGAADYPLENRWIDQRPDLLYGVGSPKRPISIKKGDLLVYYAAGFQVIFAIARATIDGAEAAMQGTVADARWPYLIHVQMYLAIPTLQLAPDWRVLGLSSGSVQQKPYVQLTDAQYEIAYDAIVRRAKPASSASRSTA